MIVDCHVHALATTPGHGYLSGYLRKRPNVLASRVRVEMPANLRNCPKAMGIA